MKLEYRLSHVEKQHKQRTSTVDEQLAKYEKETFAKKIGLRLIELRKLKGYTSYETFANDLGMTRSQYWEYENGKRNITTYTLYKILAFHNLSLEEFFSDGF